MHSSSLPRRLDSSFSQYTSFLLLWSVCWQWCNLRFTNSRNYYFFWGNEIGRTIRNLIRNAIKRKSKETCPFFPVKWLSTLGQKSSNHPKIHIFKISLFPKFTFLKSHFSQNSHFQSLIFHKIHNFKISFFTKFTFWNSHFFTKFTFFKHQNLGDFRIFKSLFLP